jgi:DNA modification methylase
LVKWAIRRGRSAIFADTGLGKTIMQLEWARQVHEKTGSYVLIVAPLCVSQQTVEEGNRFGYATKYVRTTPFHPGIYVTNYEMLDHFKLEMFGAIVLDESSILKHQDSKTRTKLIEMCRDIPYKLSCTATPSPNDYMELGNQAEFLGVMTMPEMLAMFFVHDGGETQKWRLKGHGAAKFWEWLSTWSACLRRPSDLGFDDNGFNLPKLNFHHELVRAKETLEGYLFPMVAESLQDRIKARRQTVDDRVQKVAEAVNASKEPWIVWCHLNSESNALARSIPDSIEVVGSDSIDVKEEAINGFTHGKYRVLVTKPSICGFGMNWQHCHNIAFVGLNDSYEEFYQAVRRCWRYGQKSDVDVLIVTADIEGAVLQNIKRKEEQAEHMMNELVEHTKKITTTKIKSMEREKAPYVRDVVKNDRYEAHLGDCVDVASELVSNSIDYSIFSPPFSSLYTYSNSDRDMGNSKGDGQFEEHFKFLVRELFRVTAPGREVSFHCMNLPTSKQNHGYIGIRDFRGEMIRWFQEVGFIYHSEVCIWKDPVTAMQRTKALGLLWKQIKKDAAMCRQGIADYVVTMRKPGENMNPVSNTAEDFPVSEWQKIASPVWMDINPSNTLNRSGARENEDERHIAPLQLDVIERCLRLWTRKGDRVFSPFMGIGSEGYVALKMERRFVGVELKGSYFRCAIKNLDAAISESKGLFS